MPFIIAEVGSNWSNLQHCVDSIVLAKNTGADAVKFQMFTGHDLYGTFEKDQELNRYGLPPGWMHTLKQKADRCEIEFMCSAFSLEGLHHVNKYVNFHKLASSESLHPELLKQLNAFNKPTFISLGGKSLADAKMIYEKHLNPNFIPMYCVGSYPARIIDFDKMLDIATIWNTQRYGYSDHSTDVTLIPQMAVVDYGATYIEKHVNFVGVESPDSPHSLSTNEFHLMTKILKGKPLETIPISERDMMVKHNRRLIATKKIHKGTEFKYGINYGIYRSLKEDTKGIHPFAYETIHGKYAKQFIDELDSIGLSDVQL